jgi:hypothetical protein
LERPKRFRWVYFLPALHLFACLFSFIGVLIPPLQYLGILFTFILLADLPISAPAYALVWKFPAIALIWVFVAGTFWWYLLSRGVESLFNKFLAKK